MRAKYNYRVAVQEARAVRCSKLEEVEATYAEALSENEATKSLHCTTLCREHAKYMSELEEWALEAENRSQPDFLSAHQAVLHHAQRRSSFRLQYLIRELIITTSICSICQGAPGTGATTCDYFSQARTQTVSSVKKMSFLNRCTGGLIYRQELPHGLAGRTIKLQEREDYWLVLLSKAQSCRCLQPGLWSIKEAREHYFATQPWDWAHGNMDNLSDIFRELAQGAGLVGKFILKIQVSWNGLEKLKHTNYILRSLPKGLKFLRAVSTKESPKIMGLKGIHDSDALLHFTGYTYCPSCGKDGQNEGTIVNHLRAVHYKLGLVCGQCFGCPTVTSDTLCQHGCHTCSN